MGSTKSHGKPGHRAPPRCLRLALLASGLLAGSATPAQADERSVVAWQHIVGIIQASAIVGRRTDGVECEIAVDCVEGTPAPWITTSGQAAVDRVSGAARFRVRGLVVATDPSFSNLGTTSVITHVKGTLVCNDTAPGAAELVDTDAVPLSRQGNAQFRGYVDLPPSCTGEPEDIVFLIRIAAVDDPDRGFLVDMWNAAGVYRVLREPQF
jgi:hypothetical protein